MGTVTEKKKKGAARWLKLRSAASHVGLLLALAAYTTVGGVVSLVCSLSPNANNDLRFHRDSV
jgi:hypothetical protein